MFALFFFVMADITEMRLVTRPDVWIPSKMSNATESVPRITSFANENEHHYALLYAELLRKYTSNPFLIGLASNTPVQQWFEGQGTYGYFCRHDNFISFVQGSKELINNTSNLNKTLVSFKEKYKSVTDWSLPATRSTPVAVTETQKIAMQTVVNPNKNRPNLLKLVCEEAERQNLGIAAYNSKCPILYGGKFNAIPHAHAYHPTMDNSVEVRTAFLHASSGVFIDVEFDVDPNEWLYRPHAYLGYVDNLTAESYRNRNSWVEWSNVQVEIFYADGSIQKIDDTDKKIIIHGTLPGAVASSNNLKIGEFKNLLQKGPFVSHMTYPYDVKALHIPLNDLENFPNTTEKLLDYLSKLPLNQQKFIIKQLFPFLQL